MLEVNLDESIETLFVVGFVDKWVHYQFPYGVDFWISNGVENFNKTFFTMGW